MIFFPIITETFLFIIIFLFFILCIITLYIDPIVINYILKKIIITTKNILTKKAVNIKKAINKYAKKYSDIIIHFSGVFYVILGIYIFNIMTTIYMKLAVLFQVIISAIISINLFKQKNEDVYSTNFLIFSAIYSLLITFLYNIFESDLNEFLNFPGDFNQIGWFFFWIFIMMITFWRIYYKTAKSAITKFKTISLAELKMVTYKSALQSIVGFIAVTGLASVEISGPVLLVIMSINIYALFIYPFIDINIFVLQKLKDKRSETGKRAKSN